MGLSNVDWAVMAIYFAFVLGIGFWLKKSIKTSTDFFLSGRSIPAWITGLAFISANLGAQEVIGMGALGAKYGIATSHFYWIGAIPAMVFVGVFMMPFYYGSKVRSVPEYLKARFDEKTRGFNAITFAAMTIFSSGVSLYAMGLLLNTLFGWDFDVCVWVAAVIVLVYIFLGGLTSAIYNEVLQFFLIVFGFAPLVFLALARRRRLGRARRAAQRGGHVARLSGRRWTESWRFMDSPAANPMGVEWFGLAMGLGFVLSFGYWCTDFLVVQRAMAADSMSAARRTPLIAAVPKMLFPFLVILPGMIAMALTQQAGESNFSLPKAADGSLNYNLATPMMLLHYFPSGMLGLGLTALMASFMSGMAGNVTAFNTVWTYDIYQPYINPKASDQHYLWMGRMATDLRHRRLGRRRLPGNGLQQHHGHAAAGVRVRERAAVRHVPARHVLEAVDRARRVLGTGLRHGRRRDSPWPDAARRAPRPGSKAAGSEPITPIPARWPRTSGRRSSPGPPALSSRS